MPTPAADSHLPKPKPSHHKNLAQYGKLGGRPPKDQVTKPLQDESQAFESIKDKWSYISHKLADEASKAARSAKKIDGRSLVALTTAAGIAYDKRWSKQVSDNTEIAIPDALQAAVASKLAKPLNSNDSQNMIQAKSCSDGNDEGISSVSEANDPPVDPMLLSPGL